MKKQNIIDLSQPNFYYNLNNPTEVSYSNENSNDWKPICTGTFVHGIPELTNNQIFYKFGNRGYILTLEHEINFTTRKCWMDLREGDPIYILKYNGFNLDSFVETTFQWAQDCGSVWAIFYYDEELAKDKNYDGIASFIVYDNNIGGTMAEGDNDRFTSRYFFSDINSVIDDLYEYKISSDIRYNNYINCFNKATSIKNKN